jgi:gentisate 1,2-dioxygenase
MSTATPLAPAPNEEIPAALRARMQALHMVPLWESPTAHKDDLEREQTFLWPWEQTKSILADVAQISSPRVVERRVLSLVNPKSTTPTDEATCGAITATLQMMLPGERARPHRHSMNALRFILEGQGAETIVNGRPCEMVPGDLIVTPAWCWHEHVSRGDRPTIWFDVLDVALHLFLGTEAFQPGPAPSSPPPPWSDEVFARSGLIPAELDHRAAYSPMFRYPWSDVIAALAVTPRSSLGGRRLRYVNPLTGGPVMVSLDCMVLALGAGESTKAYRSSASTVCCVVEGEGTSDINGKQIRWSARDVFTIPAGAKYLHQAIDGEPKLFTVSNRPVYERLGLLKEELVG